MKKIMLSIVLICIFIIACRKTEEFISDEGFGKMVTDVAGRITDLNNQPVSNTLISDGTNNTKTDNSGNFFLKNVELSDDVVFITVIKAGYFPGSRTFSVNSNSINVRSHRDSWTSYSRSNSTNNVNIKLIPQIVSGNFAASAGGTVQVLGGGTVYIGAGSIVYASTGLVYSGNVSVATFYLNPADTECSEYMPGDLRGVTINNQERILQSFGMLAIEMNDASGEKLQLAAGKTANITLPIPPELQASAPANIPLWYFDETKGVWKEEGIAGRQGNSYTGMVTHFSFWNYDLPAKYVKFDATFKVEKGVALANSLVTITSLTFGTRSGYTNNVGSVSGLMPANESLVINVFSQCEEIVFTKNIGPFNADVHLGTTMVTNTNSQQSFTVSGKVMTCNNTPVTDGYVYVTNGINYFNAPVDNGNFIITFPICNNMTNPVILIATDVANSRQSEQKIININNSNQDIGQITVCIDFSNL